MEDSIVEFNVLVEQDEDGIYLARVPEIERCYTQGKTLQEALDRIKGAIEVCLEGDSIGVNPRRFVGIQRVRIERPQNN